MRVLILGGTGFIGPRVARALADLGHQVTVAHTGAHEASLPPGVAHVHHPALRRVGRANLAEATDELRAVRPDVALDMFPMTEADARATVDVLRNVVSRLVAISSQDVYRAYGVFHGTETGPIEPIPLVEDAPLRQRLFPYRRDPPRPADDPGRWMDGYEKILVERVVLGDPNLAGTVLRLPAVYGPGDGHRTLPYVKRMMDRRPAILLGERLARWRWTRGYVEDVAHAIALAVADDRAAGRVYNVAEPEALSEAEWVRRIGRAAGWDGDVVVLPEDRLPEHLRWTNNLDQDVVADTRRIRVELGYAERTPADEALRRTIAWEQAEPPAEIDAAQFDYAAEDAALATTS
jgi:nucleoside-diphosphate-sugar epimerase